MSTAAESLRFAWTSRRAWWFTATARTRERYARTALGSFWLGLSNLLSIAALSTVYGTVFKVQDFRSYVVYLGIGLITWNSIASAMQTGPTLFRVNASNIKSTNINPIFYSLEEWAFQVQTFAQSFGLVLTALMLIQPSLILNLLTAGILPMLNLLLFIYWLPLMICIMGARYEDFFQLVPIVLQVMFLLSPILYTKESLGGISWAAEINPLYVILSSLRESLISGELRVGRALIILLTNCSGVALSTWLLSRERKNLPFRV